MQYATSLMYNTVMVVLTLMMCHGLVKSQGYLRAEGKIIVDGQGDTVLLRGMGLGGWMLQEGYMLQTASFASPQYQIRAAIEGLIGPSDTDMFYEQWLANHVRKIDIDSLKSWGFNSVRLPMHYNLFTLPIEDEPIPGQQTWLTKGFELTDSLIAWCRQNEMYVILDLHAAPGGQGMDQGISDYDPNKPSLWESARNRSKTIALWRRLAERYVDEPWVAGYDLINETNWELPGNVALWELYFDITNAIREVDPHHIIFIEGNWFANDFTGLTPPWDNNLVYSPHKYWSYNDQASIQWVLNLRNTHNVPLYLGESGENSNTWFRDAITLLEKHQIGWAWWPMKKIESISGPVSVIKTQAYQTLLNYWNNGGTPPSAQFAKDALFEITENLKLENCIYQKDVIDAMFQQINSEATRPFTDHRIPGVIHAVNYDLGPVGAGYHDDVVATYHVSNSNFTAWNNGWAYRNDGVDIEPIQDGVNSNGFGVGWIDQGEWLQFTTTVETAAVYDINVRVASGGTSGRFHFGSGEADLTAFIAVPNTGGMQVWRTVTVADVVLTPDDQAIRFYADQSGFNLNSFEFIEKSATSDVLTQYISGITYDKNIVQIDINKPLADPFSGQLSDFTLSVNGSNAVINDVRLNPQNNRSILIEIDENLIFSDQIRVSYNGTSVQAFDGTDVQPFFQKFIQNNLRFAFAIPGRIEAEGFYFQSGVQLEPTTDIGGGQNIGFLDIGDYLDYLILVNEAGLYQITYRHAAQSATGGLELQLIDENGQATVIDQTTFPPTGGWQTWNSTTSAAVLPAGQHQLRAVITQPLFNVNWFEFDFLTSTENIPVELICKVYPNPGKDAFHISGLSSSTAIESITILDGSGRSIPVPFSNYGDDAIKFHLHDAPPGLYFVAIRSTSGHSQLIKFIKS